MAQQGSKQPSPAALAVQHLARAGAATSSAALGAVLGRRMLEVGHLCLGRWLESVSCDVGPYPS